MGNKCVQLAEVSCWRWEDALRKCSEKSSEIQSVAKTKLLIFRNCSLVAESLLLRYKKKSIFFKSVISLAHCPHREDYLQNLMFPFAHHASGYICSLLLCRYVLLGHER